MNATFIFGKLRSDFSFGITLLGALFAEGVILATDTVVEATITSTHRAPEEARRVGYNLF